MPPESDEMAQAAEAPRHDGNRNGANGSDAGTSEALREELEQAQRERDAALQQLDTSRHRGHIGRKVRRFLVALMVLVFGVLVPVSVTLGWVRHTVVNTNGWVDTVGPIPSEPAVANAIATELTNEVFSALQAQERVSAALPPKGSFLAGPITNGVESYVQQGMAKAIMSPQFQQLWTQAAAFAQTQLVAVLKGHSEAVTTTGGQVVLNLVPLLNAGLERLGGVVSGIAGRPVTLPTLSASDVPATACAKIGSALGVELPANCAQIPLFPADKLTQAQSFVKQLRTLAWGIWIATPLIGIAAVWASDRRRRTLLQVLAAATVGLVVFRRVMIWLQNTLISSGKPENKAAREAILSHVLHDFFLFTAWFVVGFIVAAAVVAVTGPYGWARALRHKTAELTVAGYRAVKSIFGEGVVPGRASGWISAHIELLQFAGVGLGIVLILALSLSFVGVLILTALVALYELGLERVKRHGALAEVEPGPQSPAGRPPQVRT